MRKIIGCCFAAFIAGYLVSSGIGLWNQRVEANAHSRFQAAPRPFLGSIGKDSVQVAADESALWRALVERLANGKRVVVKIETEDK